jgi:thiol:disulfide interchange protein DsbA
VINPWVEKLPSDVNFVRIPAMFGGPWDAHGQMFLTLEAMGVEHKVHAAVFEAIQKEHKKLTDKYDMADFLATQGVDKDKFLATFDSFAIKGQITKARELAKKYEISGVPTMIVNGKYRFDIGSAGGAEEALKLADQLVAKERASNKAAAN